jgi:hypothetical protein
MIELRVIIAGGRDFNDYNLLERNVNDILKIYDNKIRIISGTAKGADQLGEKFAKDNHYELSRFPANWDLYGKSAGYRRNAEMAKFAVENGNIGILIAFWNGKSRGTKHMIDLAKRYNLKIIYIIEYESDGE